MGGGWANGLGRRAIVLTGDRFDDAKTAHGLLRSSPLFDVVAIVDLAAAGRRSTEVVPGGGDVPVVASVGEAPGRPEVAIVGIASYGGAIPPLVRDQLRDALRGGLDVVSGLHEPVRGDPELAALADQMGCRVVELRAPRPFADLRFWSGAILDVTVPRLAVLGTDCDVGKRTTLVSLVSELERRGRRVEMIATGQTGLLQGARQGFVMDAVPLDFVSGLLEEAVVAAASRAPDLIVVQGQGSFRGPTGQVGPQLLAHTGVTHVILHHAPARTTYKSTPGVPLGDPAGDVALIECYGATPLALTLSAAGIDPADRRAIGASLGARLGLPVAWPHEDGIGAVADLVEAEVIGPGSVS